MVAQGDNPNPAALLGVMGTFSLVVLVVFILIIIISIGFTFAYPLIVDRRLKGLDAVKLSFKAAMANFWRLLAMGLLTGVMSYARHDTLLRRLVSRYFRSRTAR